jgi:pyridoxine/pyridoxamine 5'-phosphate oxidase
MQRHRLAIEASVSVQGGPQAAVVGFVVSDAAELFFDTLSSTRKCRNLRQDSRIALVVGWDEERTVQYEGIADEPSGVELARLKELYFSVFPDGREREHWPGITYFRVRPVWARYSDFSSAKPSSSELRFAEATG